MATLNIKDFPPELHDRLKALAERERRSLAQQVIVLLEAAVASEPQQSILDLEGGPADLAACRSLAKQRGGRVG